jgi:hypothetical protein
VDVVIDPLFGEPLAAAVKAASFAARIVQLGHGKAVPAIKTVGRIRLFNDRRH